MIPFDSKHELTNIKISIPLSELARNILYHKKIEKVLNLIEKIIHPDTLNLANENTSTLVGPMVEEEKDEHTSPFYITLSIRGKLLHKSMLDSGSSHI